MWRGVRLAGDHLTAEHDDGGVHEYRKGERAEDDPADPDLRIIDQGGGVGSVEPMAQKTGPAPARLLVLTRFEYPHAGTHQTTAEQRNYFDRVAG